MLIQKKEQLTLDDWKKFVSETKESILKNPVEYLGTDLPPGEILTATIELIFQEFMSIESKKR